MHARVCVATHCNNWGSNVKLLYMPVNGYGLCGILGAHTITLGPLQWNPVTKVV